MPKVSEFLHNVFTQSGIEVTDEKLAEIVKATATLELPEEMHTKFHDTFLTLENAKGKVKPVIISEFADGIVRNLSDMAKKSGFTDDEIANLVKGKEKDAKSYASALLEATTKKAEELHKKGGNAAVEEYKKQLESLQQKLEVEKAEAIKPFQTELEGMKTKMYEAWERAEYAAIKINQSIPEIARIPAIKGAIDAELKALNGKLVYDFETGNPKLVKADDISVDLFHENKVLDFQTLKSIAVQRHKLLDEGSGGGDPDPAKIIVNPGNPDPNRTQPLQVAEAVYKDVSAIFNQPT